jgi:hypothetical protein
MDTLRKALADAGMQAQDPRPGEIDPLPDPRASDWFQALRRLGADLPPEPSVNQLLPRSDRLAKELKTAGRRREAEELTRLRDAFVGQRSRAAWAMVKEAFGRLALPEKTYRALKQEDADPEKLLPRLRGARGESLKGLGHERLRAALLGR